MPEQSMSRLKLRSFSPTALGVLGVVVSAIAACSDGTEPNASRIVYGPAQTLGQGTARVYM